MQTILTFLTENAEIIDFVQFLAYLILSAILFGKTKNSNILKEVNEVMKYRLQNYKDTEKSSEVEEFSKLVPVYRLNKATGQLEKTEETVDVHELVNSCKDTVLNSVLDRFLPDNEEEVVQSTLNTMLDVLDIARESKNLANEYRQKFSLDEKLSDSQVFAKVQEEAEKLKVALSAKNELKEVIKNEKKETLEESE